MTDDIARYIHGLIHAKQIIKKDKTPSKRTGFEAPYVSNLEFLSESIFEMRKTHRKESSARNMTLIDDATSKVTG